MKIEPFFLGFFIFVSFSAVGADRTEIYAPVGPGSYTWTLDAVAQITKFTRFDEQFHKDTSTPEAFTVKKNYSFNFQQGLCAHLKKQKFSRPWNKKMGGKALDYACRGATPALVQCLLECGVSPHIRDKWGRTLLMKTVSREPDQIYGYDANAKLEIVKLLVVAGVSVTAVSKAIPESYGGREMPPVDLLATAFWHRITDKRIIDFIVEKLTTLKYEFKYELLPSPNLIYLTMIGEGHYLLLDRILKERPPVFEYFFHNLTEENCLLDFAFMGTQDHCDVAKLLIAHGADPNGCGTGSPLFQAINNNNLNATKFLLDHGANLNIRDNTQNTPLHYAVRMGSRRNDQAMVELLLNYNRQ